FPGSLPFTQRQSARDDGSDIDDGIFGLFANWLNGSIARTSHAIHCIILSSHSQNYSAGALTAKVTFRYREWPTLPVLSLSDLDASLWVWKQSHNRSEPEYQA